MKYKIRKDLKRTIIDGDFCKHTLYRIEALKDFGSVCKGDLGGWVESGFNLAQAGDCWVFGDAIVRGDARIMHKAIVNDAAEVKDFALVWDSAVICGRAHVYGRARVHNFAVLTDNAHVGGRAKVAGRARLCGDAFFQARGLVNDGVHRDIITDYIQ